jgi:outer membrane lipoprotein LolB
MNMRISSRISSHLGSRLWRAAAFSLALGSAGCANMTPGPAADTGVNAASARVYRQDVTLEGRLSLHYQQNNQNQSVYGSFVWQQTHEQIHLQLLSPLGQTIAMINIKPGLATLTQSGKPPRSADDANQLTEQTLGWPLPIAGLRDWLQGFASDAQGKPFIAQARSDDAGNTVITRDGWRIQYVNWQTIAGDSMPKRIDLERYTDQAGEVAIRIVIDKASAS